MISLPPSLTPRATLILETTGTFFGGWFVFLKLVPDRHDTFMTSNNPLYLTLDRESRNSHDRAFLLATTVPETLESTSSFSSLRPATNHLLTR